MENKALIRRILFLNLLLSAAVRLFLAGALELGNDEAYYRMYALYPAMSHFDHPPMVGWFIQFFSLNLLFDSELFIRISAVVAGTFNTWLVYAIGKRIKDETAGLYASILYSSSAYCFLIAGTFILPDTPLVLFWLISLYFLTRAFSSPIITAASRMALLVAGIAIGLGLLSKYTAAFLWIGALGFILLHHRKWLREPALYLSVTISFLLFLPVILWNVQHGFEGALYHQERVSIWKSGIRADLFLLEALGELLYHNPVNVVLIVFSLAALAKGNSFLPEKSTLRILLYTAIPVIVLFLSVSLFRRTLPHWSGPGYVSLSFIAAAFLAEKYKGRPGLPGVIKASAGLLLLFLMIGYAQVTFGIIPLENTENTLPHKLGKKDVSLDLYGWGQLGQKTAHIIREDHALSRSEGSPVLVTYRWFPAANIDYYVCRRKNCTIITIGQLSQTHKFEDISRQRNALTKGMNIYYLTTSRDFREPEKPYKDYFEYFELLDTIPVFRCGNRVMNGFLFKCHNLKFVPEYLLQ